MPVANSVSKWEAQDSHSTLQKCLFCRQIDLFLGLCRHRVHRPASQRIVTVHAKSDSADLDRNVTFQYRALPNHLNFRDAPSQMLPGQLLLCQLVPDQLLLCQLLPHYTVSPLLVSCCPATLRSDAAW